MTPEEQAVEAKLKELDILSRVCHLENAMSLE